MRKNYLSKWLLLLCALVAGSGSVWAETVTLASWNFTSTNYPSNKTNFFATGGSCTGSTFYLNGSGSTWNSSKGYAFTSVTDITITLKTTVALPAGTEISFSADTYYNKASNAPMKGFNLTASENGGAYSTTGLNVTSFSLSASSATKTCVYTLQNALSVNSTLAIKYTQTGTAGSGQGYFGNINITYTPVVSAYTITAVSNNESYGTVSGTTTITAYPKNDYRVVAGDGGYTVTSGTATVTNNGDNTFFVTPTSACTVQINFEPIPTYTVSFDAEGGSYNGESITETLGGQGVTLPAATISVDGWEFAGWAESRIYNTNTMPTLYNGTYHPTANITLHAVYTLSNTKTTFTRVTSLDQISDATKIAVVSNYNSKILTHDASLVNAPTETDGEITVTANQVFVLSGNNTTGYILTGANGTLSQANISTSNNNDQTIDWSGTNNTWIIYENTYSANHFALRNAASDKAALEQYNGWKTEYHNDFASRSFTAMKLYVYKTAYNSNPSEIINPTVVFTTSGNKNLYVKDDASYTNAANVTGVSKDVTYTSSDPTVATVSNAGVVTALKSGSTTITAKVDAEIGVSSEASASYVVVVKDAKTIAGLKTIDNTSGKTFTADLTNAVVTYVKDNYAYIQDATAAIMVNFANHDLTAGKKINGAVSGTVKITNSIDQLSALNISLASVTEDGDIPAATELTVAGIKDSGTTYDGKLVKVNAATVYGSMASTANTGSSIKDGSRIDNTIQELNIYAPNQGVETNAQEIGSFTGFISLYNGSTYRLNIYDQSQISLTQNAPTAQPLAFASDAVELDEDTEAYTNFSGQTVSGAVEGSTVTYDIAGDAIGTVSSTGVITLNGTYGTATITATATAITITEGGVTTPYTETTKSYTVTTYPRYTSTFNINGEIIERRQATHGAEIVVPTPDATVGEYNFIGWATSAIATSTDNAPEMVTPPTTPTSSVTYYAVYAIGTGTPLVEHTSTFTVQQASEPSTSPYVHDGSSWTWSNVTFSTSASACMPAGSSISFTLPIGGKAVSLTINNTTNTWAGTDKVEVNLTDNASNAIKTFNVNSLNYDFTSTYDHASSYTLTAPSGNTKNAWINTIVFEYTTGGISYSGYCTSFTANPSAPVVNGGTITLTTSENMAGWRTFYDANKDYEVDANTTIYVVQATSATANVVELTALEATKIPATAPVILKTTASNREMTLTETTGAASLGTNLLTVTDGTNDANGYRLGYNATDGVAFYPYTATAPAAGIVYLASSNVNTGTGDARGLRIIINEATGIAENEIMRNVENEKVYNLNGQRVDNPKKGGLYIVNGKKVIKN